jgi:hypothetical protein
MNFLGDIKNFAQTVTMVTVLFAVVFFSPTSAHAGMDHGETGSHKVEHVSTSIDHDVHDTVANVDCDTDHSKHSNTHDSETQCCSSICVSTIVFDHIQDCMTESSDSHTSLPVHALPSMIVPGFLRPPNA